MEPERRRCHNKAVLHSSLLSRKTSFTSHQTTRPREMTFTSGSQSSSSKLEVDTGRPRGHHRHNAIEPVTANTNSSTVHPRLTPSSSSYHSRHSSSRDITTGSVGKTKDMTGPKCGDGGGERLRDNKKRDVRSSIATMKRASIIPLSDTSYVSSSANSSSRERSRSQLPFLHAAAARMSRTRSSSDVSPSTRSFRRSGRSESSKVMLSKSCPTLDIPADDYVRNGNVRHVAIGKSKSSTTPSFISFESRSKATRSSAESVNDQLLCTGQRSSDLDDRIKKSAPRLHSKSKSQKEEEIGANRFKRENARTSSRNHAGMLQMRNRARAHSQEPRDRRLGAQRDQRSSADEEASTPLRSSNSFDGHGISSGTSSYIAKHPIRNQQGASSRSRNHSLDRCGAPTRSRSLSQDRRETTAIGSLLALNKSAATLPTSLSSSSDSQYLGRRSKSPASQGRRIPPPPPRRCSIVSDSTIDTSASERLLKLSKKMCTLKNKKSQHSHRPSSSAGLSTSDDIDVKDGDGIATNRRNISSEGKNLVQLDQHGIARLPPTKAASRHSESNISATPSFVSLSTQSQTTGPTSPDSLRAEIACTPQGVPFSSTRRGVDNPPPPPPRQLTRRSSNARDDMLSSLESSQLMMSSCPTLIIPADYDNGNSQLRNAAVPPAVICQNIDTDAKSNKQLRNVAKGCPRKVTKMSYTDPFGDSGLYTGEVDEESRPHGKGKMKYDNGIFFEGTWYYGCKNDRMGLKNNGISTMGGASTACLQQDGSTRDRILSGFTSWKGKKSATDSSSSASSFVYGMEWVDSAGLSGKYTGRVNDADVPDGKGVMRYNFGLIAEGDWIKGVLNTGAGAGVNPIVAGNAGGLSGAMSVAPGMSVAGGGGAMSVVSGLGMMSIGGGAFGGCMGGFYPPTPSVAAGVYNSMVNTNANNMMTFMQPTKMFEVRNPAGKVADSSFWSSARCVMNY